MPLGASQTLIQRQRCETGPSASRCVICHNFVRRPIPSLVGADKQPGTTVGRRAAETDLQARDACYGSMFARYVNLHEAPASLAIALAEENYAALREAVLPAQPEEPWATNDRAKGPTGGGRRVVIVEGNAQ